MTSPLRASVSRSNSIDLARPPSPIGSSVSTPPVLLPRLSPPTSLSLAASALYLLPRLVQHRRITASQMSLLKMAALRSEFLAPWELYLVTIAETGPQDVAVDELVTSLDAIASELASLHTDNAEVVRTPLGTEMHEDGEHILIPHVPSAVSLTESAPPVFSSPPPLSSMRSMLTGGGSRGTLDSADTEDVGLTIDGPLMPSPTTAPSTTSSSARVGEGGNGAGAGAGSAPPPLSSGVSSSSLGSLMSPPRGGAKHRVRTTRVKGSAVRGADITGKAHSLLLRKDICILYYARDMKAIAERICALSGGTVILHEVVWGNFPDGFPSIKLKQVKDIRYHACAFLASLTNTEGLFEQLSVMHALPRYLAKRFTIIVPYFPTGTMERIDKIGDVATASSLARLLSTTPPACNGPSLLSILDIHALQELFYFSDQLHVRLKSCIGLLKERLAAMTAADPSAPTWSIAFPDEGAFKRFAKKFPSYDTIVCDKRRVGDSRIVTIKEGTVEGRHVVIVDDLVQSGGTLLNCAKAVLEAGAAAVSCYVTHAVFPCESWRKFVAPQPDTGRPLMRRFWITDSIPDIARSVKAYEPFEVLSIAPVCLSLLQY